MRTIPLQNALAFVARAVVNNDEFEIGIALVDYGTKSRFEVLLDANNRNNDRNAGKWRRGRRARVCVWRHRENWGVAQPNRTRLFARRENGRALDAVIKSTDT